MAFLLNTQELNGLPLLGRDAVGDLSAVSSVVHKKELNIFLVTDKELFESVGEEVSGLSVGALTDAG